MPEHPSGLDEPAGPFGHSAMPILVDGQQRVTETLTYGRYQALRFRHASLLVTVVSRNQLPERPAFARVTDLEPFLAKTVYDLETARDMWRIIHEARAAHVDAWRRDQDADDR